MNIKSYYHYLEKYVTGLFIGHKDRDFPYHNLRHTKNVVSHCQEMSFHYLLTDQENIILYTAAWFHDTGHLFTTLELHETESIAQMHSFIKKINLPAEDVKEIENCISSTRLPQQPTSLLQEILCDADLYHLGTKDFHQTDELVKRETETRLAIKIEKWQEKSIRFLESHHYFTEYCKKLLEPGKQKNIQMLKKLPAR